MGGVSCRIDSRTAAQTQCLAGLWVGLQLYPKEACSIKALAEEQSEVNGVSLPIRYSVLDAQVCVKQICYSTDFILMDGLEHDVLYGMPFLTLLKPFTCDGSGIVGSYRGRSVYLRFSNRPSMSSRVNELSSVEDIVEDLKDQLLRISEQLNDPRVIQRIEEVRKRFKDKVCSLNPTAFMERNKWTISLPYEDSFKETDIPTKARAVQMTEEERLYFKAEI